MTFVLDCTIRVSVILAAALLTAYLLPGKSAANRHWILAAGLFGAAITPVAMFVMPSWNLGPSIGGLAPVSSSSIGTSRETGLSPVASLRPDVSKYILEITWLTGLCAGLATLAIGLTRLARVAFFSRRLQTGVWVRLAETISRQYGLRRDIRLLQSRNSAILVTWGVLQPKVLLPSGCEDWPEDRVEAVLFHELAHIRRADWLVQTIAEVLRALYWFNPLVWVVCNRLRLESEYACDDTVLAQGISGSRYAAHLLDVVRALQQTDRAWSAALAMARPSTVERRFTAMLNPSLNRRPVTRLAMLAIVVITLSVTLPLAALSSSTPLRSTSIRTIKTVSDAPIEAPEKIATAPSEEPAAPRPARVSAVPSPRQKQYAGDVISVDFKNLDIKDFFRLISNASGLNVIVDPSVSGTVTMTLTDVPWEQVLDVMLTQHQLSSQRDGNVMRIAAKPLVSAEPIKLQFEFYKNGVLAAAPMISTPDGTKASIEQNGPIGAIAISVIPTRSSADTILVYCEITVGSQMAKTRILISKENPGIVSLPFFAAGSDSIELHIVVPPEN